MKTKQLLTTASRLGLALLVLAGLRSIATTKADSAAVASSALSFVEVQKDGVNGVDGLNGATSVAVSPDGNHVYVAGYYGQAVAIFERDGASGTLSFVGKIGAGVWPVTGLNSPQSVAISPDGDHVYVSSAEGTVVAFSRNETTGELTYVETEWDGVGDVDGLASPESVAVSPDGNHVYVAGRDDDAVVIFSRNETSGELTYVDTEWDGVDGVDGLDYTFCVTVSPDGDHVYATGFSDSAVAVFGRDEISGTLSFVEVVKNSDPGVDGLLGAHTVVVSPDGEHVYVTATGGSVAVFGRDGTTGELSFVEVEKDGINGVDGLASAQGIAVSPDGGRVYVGGEMDDAVAVFNRNRTTGALTYVGMQQDGVGGVDGLDSPRSVAVSPDSDHVYVASWEDDAVAVFESRFPIFLPLVLRNY